MQMEPTLSPEENQDKLEQTGEDQITTNDQEKEGEEHSEEENTSASTKTSPIFFMAL